MLLEFEVMKELRQYPLENIPVHMSRKPCFDETIWLLGSGRARSSLELIVNTSISYGVSCLEAIGFVFPVLFTYNKQKKTAVGRLPYRSEIWDAAVREVIQKADAQFYVIVADTEPEAAQDPAKVDLLQHLLGFLKYSLRGKVIAYACDRHGNEAMATRRFRREMIEVFLNGSLEYGFDRVRCPWKLPHKW
jgi:hypothetical protein